MSDLSRIREARRALKTFLKSRALTGGPVLSRRFSPRPGQGVVELTEFDIRVLLDAERAVRKAAAARLQGAGDMLLPTLPQMFRALFPEARDK
jgi:hypothetical protein